MAKGDHSSEPFDEDTYHRQLVWEEFLQRAVDVGNKAVDYFELADLDEDIDEEEANAIYEYRWQSAGDVVITCFNFLWPEIESLAIKLGVPFQPEIAEIHGLENE